MKTTILLPVVLTSLLFIFIPQRSTATQRPLSFTENLGQWDAQILFRATLDGGSLFMEKDKLTFNFYDQQKYRALHHGHGTRETTGDLHIGGHAYQVRFIGCNKWPVIETANRTTYYENFYLGSDKNTWRSNVRNFETVWYRGLYNGIDYEIGGESAGFKYNFYVAKGADPSQIRLHYEGVEDLQVNENLLSYKLSITRAIELSPYAYQLINTKRVQVNCKYVLRDQVLSFEFPDGYNKNYELVIDPVLVFAAQTGSTADNFGMTATWDAAGNFYSGGTAFSNGYPTTVGAYSNFYSGTPQSGLTDVVISKFSSNGSTLLYSTYFGGSDTEIITSMIVDHSDNLCVLGTTGSTDFPTTTGAYDVSFNGGKPLAFLFNGTTFANGCDLYVGKFNSTGTTLVACTLLGGSENDGVNHVNHITPISLGGSNFANEYVQDSLQFNYGDQYRGEIQVDRSNQIYIASSTRSPDYPLTNALQNNLGGKQDAVISKLNPALTQLLFSTYLGGSSNDCGNSLIVVEPGEVVITGGTCSSNFPVTTNAYKQVYSGGKADAYISRLSTISGLLINSTLLGSTQYDQSYFVQNDKNGNVYVFGQSLGAMPVVGLTYNNAGTHQFISKFNASLTTLLASTTFGNNLNDIDITPFAFSVDYCGNIYITGWGGAVLTQTNTMTGMPLLSATQSTTDGHDFYLMELSPNMSSLIYGSYFGGSISAEHVDGGTSRIDKAGVFYQAVCAGCGGNDDFPVTPGAYPGTPGNSNHSNNCNAGIFKLASQSSVTASNILSTITSGCVPLNVTLTNAAVNYSTYTWYLPGNIVSTTVLNPSLVFTTPGSYTISLVVANPQSCNLKDSSAIYIHVAGIAPVVLVNSSNSVVCLGETATLTASGAANYQWNSVATGSSLVISPGANTTYTVTGTNANGCMNTTLFTQSVSLCTGNGILSKTENSLFIHPNPTDHHILLRSGRVINFIKISNVQGQVFAEIKVNKEKTIEVDLSAYARGIYFVTVVYEDATFDHKLVVRE